MRPDADYTLAELASLSDVPPRTIRYYVAQGLLPSPEAAGPATRYSASALARLRLIKQLQRQHLPLAEIRRELATLTDEEALELARSPAEIPPDSALDYVRSLLAPEPPQRVPMLRRSLIPSVADTAPPGYERRLDHETPPAPAAALPAGPPPATPTPGRRIPTAPTPTATPTAPTPGRRIPTAPTPTATPTAPTAAATPTAPTAPTLTAPPIWTPERSQWERIVLEPDVELHVRRPLSRIANKRVDRLLAFARQLLEEDKP